MCAGSALAAGRQVLVVGDGVAGLSVAVSLRRRGLDPTVVAGTTDGSTDHGVIDGAVTLWPTGVALLDELGATADLGPSSTEIDTWLLPAEDGTAFERLETGHHRHPLLVADRRRLRWALRERLPTNSIRETKTPRTLCTDDGPPVVEFEDGVRERFDLVVGADGIDSWVRAVGFDGPEPAPWGTTTWTFRADDAAVPGAIAEAWGPDAVVTVVPTPSGACGRLVTTARDAAAADVLAGVLDHAEHPLADEFDPPGPDALVGAPDRVLRADPWVTDRLALVGDAAHSLPPCSLGPTLAIEDASVLAEEVAIHETPTAALRRYEHRRRGHLCRLDRRPPDADARRRHPLSAAGLSDLQELRRSLLHFRFPRDSAGPAGDTSGRF